MRKQDAGGLLRNPEGFLWRVHACFVDMAARTASCARLACIKACPGLLSDSIWGCGAASPKLCRWGSCAAMSAGSGTQAAAAAAAAVRGAACCSSPARLLDAAERLRSSVAVAPLLIAPETGVLLPAVSSAAASRELCGCRRVGMPPAAQAMPGCEAPSMRANDASLGLTGAAMSAAAAGAAAGLATSGILGCTASAAAAVDAAATGSSCKRREHVVQPRCERCHNLGLQRLHIRFEAAAKAASASTRHCLFARRARVKNAERAAALCDRTSEPRQSRPASTRAHCLPSQQALMQLPRQALPLRAAKLRGLRARPPRQVQPLRLAVLLHVKTEAT